MDRFREGDSSGDVSVALLYIDFSGFTPMTESLMTHGREGAEVLSQILNAVFRPMVAGVYREGGFISNFSGDAFTAIYPHIEAPGDALWIADRIRATFNRRRRQRTRFGDFELAIRTGVSIGPLSWGIVGSSGKAFYFRGPVLDTCTRAQHRAEPGAIVIDQSTAGICNPEHFSLSTIAPGFLRLDAVLLAPPPPARPPAMGGTRDASIIEAFLPREIATSKRSGEFRNVASVFISFQGLQTEVDIDRFASIVIDRAAEFSGYVKEIEFSGGGVIPCFFGAPVAFENNIERALDFVLAVRRDVADLPTTLSVGIRAGITYGPVFAGPIGGKERSQYALIGSMVNLAARLASSAEWGEVRVAEGIARHEGFGFIRKGAIAYKGIAEPVETFVLAGRRGVTGSRFLSNAMIGRTAELRMLRGFAEPILDGAFAGIAYIYGDPGIGKSQLAHTLRASIASDATVDWFECPCDEILRKPFNPFIAFLRTHFGLSADATIDELRSSFERGLEGLLDALRARVMMREGSESPVGELQRTWSVLGALLGLSWDESLYEQLDGKGRYDNTIAALKAFFLARSLLSPIVIQIEDGHWIDSDSAAVVTSLTRNIASYPILILVTSRYDDDGSLPRIDLEDVPEINLRVNNLSRKDLAGLAERDLGSPPGPDLVDMLAERTRGNPFFAQQMLLYFRERGMLERGSEGWLMTSDALHGDPLPETISAMLIARIDRLSQQVKDVMKAAAVIGQEFDIHLLSAMLKNDVAPQIREGEKRRIWGMIDEVRYLFKHALLRDAAYGMQLKTHLRELHRLAAEAMETIHREALAPHAADIAHHFERAEAIDRAIDYLEMAGDYARGEYRNLKAIELYDRLVLHLDGRVDQTRRIIAVLCHAGEVLELIGRWDEAEVRYRRAFERAHALGDAGMIAAAHEALGHLLVLTGKDIEAMPLLESALVISEERRDRHRSARVIGTIGEVYRNRGDYERAMEAYQRKQAICEEIGYWKEAASNLSCIGIIFEDQGDYANAMAAYARHLAISEEIGDRRGIGRALGNIGVAHYYLLDYKSAMDAYRRHMAISQELGYRRGVAIASGNMASVLTIQGNYGAAMEGHRRDLAICEELGDRRGIGDAMGNVGDVCMLVGDYAGALDAYQRKLSISRELGDRGDIALAMGGIGDVHRLQGQHAEALVFYCKAIPIFREVGTRYYSSSSLYGLAALLVDVASRGGTLPDIVRSILPASTHDSASVTALRVGEDLARECLAISVELNRRDTLLDAKVLLARIDAMQGDSGSAVNALESMLRETESDEERAALHYHLWRLAVEGLAGQREGKSAHRAESLRLYSALVAQTPRYLFTVRIAELEGEK